MPRPLKKTWILIADGARARVLESSGSLSTRLEEVIGLEQSIDLPPSRDIADDKQGRSFDSVGSHRHAMERRSDPHRELERKFAHHVAETLDREIRERSIDRLVVIAPAVTMGDLRPAFSKRVASLIVGEIVSDLTNVPNDEIVSHLEDRVPL